MVRVGSVFLNDRNNGARADKPSQIVHVPVRVVAVDTATEPEHLAHAKSVVQDFLHISPGQIGIACLYRTEQTLLSCEQQPEAVDIDAAAFQNDFLAAAAGMPGGATEFLGDFPCYPTVALPVVILGPGVEEPTDAANLTDLRLNESSAQNLGSKRGRC